MKKLGLKSPKLVIATRPQLAAARSGLFRHQGYFTTITTITRTLNYWGTKQTRTLDLLSALNTFVYIRMNKTRDHSKKQYTVTY